MHNLGANKITVRHVQTALGYKVLTHTVALHAGGYYMQTVDINPPIY